MRLAMVAVAPSSAERLQVIKQIGDVPRLALEAGPNDGYGFLGHVYATGYLRGLLESVFSKPGLDRWKPIPAERRSAGYPFPA